MIRKQIYIGPEQDVVLKQWARDLGLSEAELIRRCLSGLGRRVAQAPVDSRAWEDELAFVHARAQTLPAQDGKRSWTREELYEERIARVLP
jgi:hypothetical protein